MKIPWKSQGRLRENSGKLVSPKCFHPDFSKDLRAGYCHPYWPLAKVYASDEEYSFFKLFLTGVFNRSVIRSEYENLMLPSGQ